MKDRTSRILLALIAVSLWGLLLRPLFIPQPSQAAAPAAEQAGPPALATSADGTIVYYAVDGRLFFLVRSAEGDLSVVREKVYGRDFGRK